MIRVADYIVKTLVAHGVTDLFTVTGGGSIFLCDAAYLAKDMKWWCCHHEQAVAIAAEAYARAKDSLGVALVTSGPGGTNAITGVAGAWIDSVPNVILSGQAFLSQTIGTSGLRQLGVQEINIIDLVEPITKYAVMVEEATDIRYHLEKALYLATSGRPGPVWLDLPGNVQNAKVDEANMTPFLPGQEDKPPTDAQPVLETKVAELIRLLERSKRPLVHVGQGVRLSKATMSFLNFIEKAKIPFVTARNANDIAPSSHPQFVGRPGTFAQRGANFALQTCDLFIAIGTRLALTQTGYNTKDFAKNAVRVMVDIDQTELDKKTLQLDLKICADASVFLAELHKQLPPRVYGTDEWRTQCTQWRERYRVSLPEYATQERFINSYHFIDVLSEICGNDTVVVTDMGMAFQGTHQGFHLKAGQRLFTNSGFASMGWGLPAAVGASVAAPTKQILCITGDGGLMMNIQELATIAHHRMPVKIFILNNCGYLTIKQTQQYGFEGRVFGVDPETGLGFPDFQKTAEAYGIPATRLSSHHQLKQSLEQVLASQGPMICEIMMDPDQIQAPRALNRRMPDGTTEPTPLEDLWPYLDRDEISCNMAVANSTLRKKE